MRLHAHRATGTQLVMVADGERITAPRPVDGHDTIDIRRPIGTGGYVRFELRDGGWAIAPTGTDHPGVPRQRPAAGRPVRSGATAADNRL